VSPGDVVMIGCKCDNDALYNPAGIMRGSRRYR
jgi:hypothetical protein